MTFPAVRLTSTPCRMAASCTAAASMFSSRPHIRPAPRTSTIAGCFFCIARSFGFEMRADGLHVIHQARGELVEADQRRAAGEQVSAEGGAMVAECERGRNVFFDERRAHRHAAGERLADRHQVGAHAELLEVERLPGAAKAALHFVGNQQRAGLRGTPH